jgi:hypothetical protein
VLKTTVFRERRKTAIWSRSRNGWAESPFNPAPAVGYAALRLLEAIRRFISDIQLDRQSVARDLSVCFINERIAVLVGCH